MGAPVKVTGQLLVGHMLAGYTHGMIALCHNSRQYTCDEVEKLTYIRTNQDGVHDSYEAVESLPCVYIGSPGN